MDWTPIPHHPDYDINLAGQIRSRKRSEPRILKLNTHPHGYLMISLEGSTCYIHRLLLETFIGPPPFYGAVGRHLDDDPLNNNLANLAWGTQAENVQDILDNGNWKNQNVDKQRCPQGHEYDYVYKDERTGWNNRQCKTCRVEATRRWRARQKA